MDRIKDVDQYMAEAPSDQVLILESLREFIAEAVPEAKEQFKWGQPVYGTVKDFVYLKYTKKHVNLGFFNFEKVDDPDGWLEGTGVRMRHIKITDISQFDPDRLKQMIKQAATF